jgi:hypothetical protein
MPIGTAACDPALTATYLAPSRAAVVQEIVKSAPSHIAWA